MLDLGRTFLQSVERSPNALAIVDGEHRLSYAQWFGYIRRVAGGLKAIGLRHGDHLLLVLQNRWEMATLHWACQFLGVIATPVNWRAKPEEVEYFAVDAEVKAMVFEAVSAEAVLSVPRGVLLIAVGGAPGGTCSFEDLVAGEVLEPLLAVSAEDFSLMLYTSGTTGKPRGVPRRHRQERAAALAHVAQNLYRRGERTLGVMPLYHTMGVRSLLAMALIDGLFVCLPRFDAQVVLHTIQAERLTCLYLVPTLYHDILGHLDFARTDVSSVTKIGFAGAPMHEALLKRVDAAFRPQLFVNHYGSSEVYTFTVDQNAARKPGCAGRSGINTRIRVVRLAADAPEELAA
ncbi:MAG: AMP-binding protein, partial [Burkholderiales bacterium]